MIFTECITCQEPFVYPYEAGEEPVGVYAKVPCEACGANNYVQRLSTGVTYSEPEFLKLKPVKINRDGTDAE